MADMPAPMEENIAQDLQKNLNLTTCSNCENAFSQENLPKLLPCLHTACQTCVFSQTATEEEEKESDKDKDQNDSSKVSCPTCSQKFPRESVINNPFVTVTATQDPLTSEDGSPSSQKFPVCTSCDDNQKASSFCIECQEWLCDPCVIAHKRVRMTKDHTFSTKLEPEDSSLDTSIHKQVYCHVHKTEKMKLFCISCDKLTCRDCQLLEHKDHKYQFIEETIADQKKNLQISVESLRGRLEKNEKVAEKIAAKEKDIKRQQVDVFNEVRQVADQITNDLIKWCKQLLNFLQGVCNCRTRDLSLKKQEFDDFADRARHCIDFVEYAVASGNDMSVLSIKGLMDSQLKTLLEKDISIQDSMFELDIKYENDVNFLKKNVSRMGFINVNGKSYPTSNTAPQTASPKPTAPAVAKATTSAPAAPAAMTTSAQSLSQQVADLLNMYPPTVKENYKNLAYEHRRAFLQRLVTAHIRNKGNSASPLVSELASYLNVGSTSHAAQQSHKSDSNAIQELYRISQQRPQQQPVRPTGTFYPETTNQAQDQAQKAQNYYPTCGGGQGGGFGFPKTTAVVPPPPPLNRVPTAPGVPTGRFNIDPLNLRLKQEPKDENQYRSACQFEQSKQNNHPTQVPAILPRTIQSPPSSISPLLRASPGTLDGGQRTSESPALPDVNVMDSDRNAILQGLNTHPARRFNTYNLYSKHDPSDPSEDYCAVCHNGGDLLCCDRCPKVFHLQCHIPAISASVAPSEQWTCMMCVPEEELVLESPVVKEFEITSTGKRKAPSGLTDKELKTCERLLLELFCLETSTCFHEPVSKQVPNYYKIITNPMDFSLIKLKLRRGHFNHYNTIEEFLTDIKLVFKNCYTYNNPASEIYSVGKSIDNFFESLVQTFLPSYLDFIRREVPSPAGSTNSLEPNGDAPRPKKRRSPALDASRDSPVHIS